jgi:dethiobiotin synthetase
MKPRGYFIAGTDTGVGKTWASCGLIAGFRQLGIAAGGMKPVLAGINGDDVDKIVAISEYLPGFEAACTYRLAAPIAPNLAAQRESKCIEVAPIIADFERCAAIQSLTIVEGTGGWLCPVSESKTMADVASALGLPVILVVGLRLGCLSHALLTAECINRSGLPLAGWVANAIDPSFAAAVDNTAFLQRRLPGPLLANLPHSSPQSRTPPGLAQAAQLLARC